MKDNKHNFILILLALTLVISIYLIITNKEKFTAIGEYKNKHKLSYKLKGNCRAEVLKKYGNRGGLSWEGDMRYKTPEVKQLLELIYRRDCPPPMISKMQKYIPPFLPKNNNMAKSSI